MKSNSSLAYFTLSVLLAANVLLSCLVDQFIWTSITFKFSPSLFHLFYLNSDKVKRETAAESQREQNI